MFKYFEARTPDTFTEVQEHTMTWHFQQADDFAEVQAGNLQARATRDRTSHRGAGGDSTCEPHGTEKHAEVKAAIPLGSLMRAEERLKRGGKAVGCCVERL